MITIMAYLTMHILIICNRSLYLFTLDREGLERTVVHLEIDVKHYYYRNLKALCEQWCSNVLCVSYAKFRNFGLSPDKPYLCQKCII